MCDALVVDVLGFVVFPHGLDPSGRKKDKLALRRHQFCAAVILCAARLLCIPGTTAQEAHAAGIVAIEPLRLAFKVASDMKSLCRKAIGVEYVLDQLFRHTQNTREGVPGLGI